MARVQRDYWWVEPSHNRPRQPSSAVRYPEVGPQRSGTLDAHLACRSVCSTPLRLQSASRFFSLSALAVVATSVVLFVSSLIAYFMLQRFAAPLDRTGIVISNPLLYPVIALAAFLACTAAAIVFCGWFWGVAPIVGWFVLGFACAELAIRRYIAKSKQDGTDCDRRLAVFALNNAQGRRSLFGMDRYPFP